MIHNPHDSSFELAKALFSTEKWISTERNIWVAKSRLPQKRREPGKWEKEMAQVRILTGRGSVAYFLPEIEIKGETKRRSADLVLDGEVTEMKTVSGTRATLGGEFRLAYKQGAALLADKPFAQRHSVFIWLLTDLSTGSVKAKIAGELKNRVDDGRLICFFEKTKELHIWSYNELRSIIGN